MLVFDALSLQQRNSKCHKNLLKKIIQHSDSTDTPRLCSTRPSEKVHSYESVKVFDTSHVIVN